MALGKGDSFPVLGLIYQDKRDELTRNAIITTSAEFLIQRAIALNKRARVRLVLLLIPPICIIFVHKLINSPTESLATQGPFSGGSHSSAILLTQLRGGLPSNTRLASRAAFFRISSKASWQ